MVLHRTKRLISPSGPGSSANSQPDWQPAAPFPTTPETPFAVLLPGTALLIGGGYTLRRRRHSPRSAG